METTDKMETMEKMETTDKMETMEKMETKKTKKELQEEYKARKVIGGVFIIRNNRTGRILISSTNDLQGSRNRFAFSQSMGSAMHMKLQKDWEEYGPDQFSFEIIEEIQKNDKQTLEEFNEDIKLLKTICCEKMTGNLLY